MAAQNARILAVQYVDLRTLSPTSSLALSLYAELDRRCVFIVREARRNSRLIYQVQLLGCLMDWALLGVLTIQVCEYASSLFRLDTAVTQPSPFRLVLR